MQCGDPGAVTSFCSPSKLRELVDLVGIEPTTSSMPWKRAPSCATGPLRKNELNRRSPRQGRGALPAAPQAHDWRTETPRPDESGSRDTTNSFSPTSPG